MERLREGPIDPRPDTRASGEPPLLGELAFSGADWSRLVEVVGARRATWMFAWSPHHADFNPAGLAFSRTLHDLPPYLWVESARPFSQMAGAGSFHLVPVDDEVWVYRHRPWAAFAGIVRSAGSRPDLDTLTAAFRATGAARVLRGQDELDGLESAVLERWRPPSVHEGEARFFARTGPVVVEVNVELDARVVALEQVS